jgi:hypothetical protein
MKTRFCLLALTCVAAGCGDFLTGPGVSEDPNAITALERPGPLYLGIQQAAGQQEGIGLFYTQQIAGLGRQAAQTDAYLPYFLGIELLYGGAGLLDIRKMQQLARGAGDSLYLGIGKVYEALRMGDVAANWGDIPYREAADSGNREPSFDPQLQVYTDIQQQLDSAIHIFLMAVGATNAGPTADGGELVYAGRDADALRAVYSAAARSLKARYYLHVAAASRAGINGAPPAAYDSALKYATSGIASTSDDLLWPFDAPSTLNFWSLRVSTGDLGPGAALIEIFKRRILEGVEDEQRLAFYFTAATDGVYRGFRPAGAIVAAAPGIYDGSGPYSGFGGFLDLNATGRNFRTPGLSYAETQLIAAEAAWQVTCAGCSAETVVPAAQSFLDNARRGRQYGTGSEGPVLFGDAPGVLPASLRNIIEEKYVTLFLNPEVWNDWKRTCLPSLAPALGAPSIPGRLPYSIAEINANPNVPSVSSAGVQITSVSRNPNQPSPCPALNYIDSNPLAN